MMTRGRFLKTLYGTAASARLSPAAGRLADVVVYGGSPASLAAAQAIVRVVGTAIIVEPTRRNGGLVTGGIACTDSGTPHFVSGLSAEFFDKVASDKRRSFPNPVQPHILFRGPSIP